jgi:hypothetical protein
MNIYIGKMGRSVLFNRDSWGSIGGDNEAPKFYENLFHKNPQNNYYILGGNDFDRLTHSQQMEINKHGNVYNIWGKPFVQWKKKNPMDESLLSMKYLDHWVRTSGVKFDAGIVFGGPTGTTNVVGKSTLMKTPTQLAKPLVMLSRYCAPMMYFMNEYKVPYMLIVNDPRHFPPMARDWMHPPEFILSQYDCTADMTIRAGYTDSATRKHPVKMTYDAVETIFLLGENSPSSKTKVVRKPAAGLDAFFEDASVDCTSVKKDINFMIVLNEGRPSRYDLLKSCILDAIDNVEIYGKWDPRVIGPDTRFKGSMEYHKLHEMLPRVKYTYCIPIKKGWVTAKFWEMIYHGIVPFVHPTYDQQNHIGFPDFLRVDNANTLNEKIQYLESNPDRYNSLMETLKSLLKDEYFDGTYLNNLVEKKLIDLLATSCANKSIYEDTYSL